MRFTGYLTIPFSLVCLSVGAQPINLHESNSFYAHYDSIVNQQNSNIAASNQIYSSKVLADKATPEMLIEYRLEQINSKSPITFHYTPEVYNYIQIFSGKRKADFENIIGLSAYYFPIFEEYLSLYNLPLELKYLAVVESGLNPLAVSKSGAVGLWQFLYPSAKLFDLEITSYIDARSDVYLSTDAACKYFKYLYNIFNDWELVLAAYNSGAGEIRDAIQRSGGKLTFSELIPYLPLQTRTYVPAFVAATYVFNHYSEHGLHPSRPDIDFFDTDTVQISYPIALQQIASILQIQVEVLQQLNPVYKTGFVPLSENKSSIILPSNLVVKFRNLENQIYAHRGKQKNYITFVENAGSTQDKIKQPHIVVKGEYLHKIAMKYNCTMEDVKKWNNLTGNYIYPGQELVIWVSQNEYVNSHDENPDVDTISGPQFKLYTIQEKDTLWEIAKKFNLESVSVITKNNNIEDANSLKPGQVIKIILDKMN